jgi:hypothetical protein
MEGVYSSNTFYVLLKKENKRESMLQTKFGGIGDKRDILVDEINNQDSYQFIPSQLCHSSWTAELMLNL